MMREQVSQFLRNIINLLIWIRDLNAEIMYPIHIEPFVHKFFPEIEAIISCIHYLSFEKNEKLFEIIDFHDIYCLLIAKQWLVLPVHYMFNTLFTLVKEILIL
jgi:hypothetical protein